MTNRTRLISGRVPVSNSTSVSPDRYQYLDLSSAEPNLGTANTGDILSYDPENPGQRKWLPQNTIVGTIGVSAFAAANIASANTIYISGVDAWQNTQIVNINNYASGAYNKANNALPQSGGTVTGNLSVLGANVALGDVGNVHIYGGNTGQLLSTDNFGNLEWIDLPTPNTITYTANSLVQTNGVYVSGNLWSTTIFGDYGQTDGAYVLTDGSGSAPAWYINFDFINVEKFNRVVLDINYTQSSGHTIYVQLYNTNTLIWDSIGTYTGLGSYYAFALEVINETNYISNGIVQLRLYHSNGGNTAHQTSIDYVALEQSYQGPQGPRGPTGPTGSAGQGLVSGGTIGQVLIKNSSTNYDTSWSNNLIDTTANTVYTQGVDTWQNTQIVNVNTYATSAYGQANTVGSQLSANVSIIQGINSYQNTQISSINANTIYSQGVDATQNTNITSALGLAASAFLTANAALTQSGGTITNSLVIGKDLTVSGNLTVLGNSTTITTSQLEIGDSLIYLANNNLSSDTVDIGLIGHYDDGVDSHTGIFRDPILKEWIFFKGYTPEVQSNNLINIAHPSFAYANVYANVFKGNLISTGDVSVGGNLTVNGISLINTLNTANANIALLFNIDNYQNTAIQNSYNQANSATILAQAAFDKANTSSGGGGTSGGIINLNMPGLLNVPFAGSARFYPTKTITLNTVYANLGGYPSANLQFVLLKNGSNIGNSFIIRTSSPVMTPVTLSGVSLTANDYLTINLLGPGEIIASDLWVKILYS